MANDLQIHSVRQGESAAGWSSGRDIVRLALAVAVTSVILFAAPESPVFAKGGSQTDSADSKAPAIDPDAMAALDKMGAYLRSLKAFEVTADVTTDNVLDDGQAIQFATKVVLVAALPNRMRIDVSSDDARRLFFFDGKNFTMFAQLEGYYATVPAPATIAELNNVLADKYDIELPLVDLFRWGTNEATVKKIKEADDIGPSTVDGVTCEQYAFRQEGADWQIWIQLGQFPLPRKLVIRTLTDDAKPQHSENLTWNLAPSFSDDAFTFDPPADARRITLKAETDKKDK